MGSDKMQQLSASILHNLGWVCCGKFELKFSPLFLHSHTTTVHSLIRFCDSLLLKLATSLAGHQKIFTKVTTEKWWLSQARLSRFHRTMKGLAWMWLDRPDYGYYMATSISHGVPRLPPLGSPSPARPTPARVVPPHLQTVSLQAWPPHTKRCSTSLSDSHNDC